MTASNNHEFSENRSISMPKRDKELLEKICGARGEDPSGFVRRAIRKKSQPYATYQKKRRRL